MPEQPIVKFQEDLYLEEPIHDLEYFYSPLTLRVCGGSGNGAFQYSLQNITGEGELVVHSNSISTVDHIDISVEFCKPGKILLRVYREGSTEGIYQYASSKVLAIELTLEQTQIEIITRKDSSSTNWNCNIGDSVPVVTDHWTYQNIKNEDVQYFDTNTVQVFIVNISEDYYKFDVFSRSTSTDDYDNGIKYMFQPDGNWKVIGTLTHTGESLHRIITSTLSLPNYLKSGKTYRLCMDGTVPLLICWYTSEGASSYQLYYSSGHSQYDVHIDDNFTGVEISLRVFGNKDTTYDQTIQYHLFDLESCKIDNTHPGVYSVSARGATVPYDSNNPDSPTNYGYSSNFKYRSSKLIYENTKNYRVYTQYNTTKGSVIVPSYAIPYTDVNFTVEAYSSYMFQDGIIDTEKPSTIHVIDLYDSSNTYTFETTSVPVLTNDNHCLTRCSYKFTMPITDVLIICNFYLQSQRMYMGDFPYGMYTNPYIDIDVPGSSQQNAAILNNSQELNEEYIKALIYCRYASRVYYGQENDIPLIPTLTENGNEYFYRSDYAIAETKIHPVRRREVIETLRRISHGSPYIPYTGETDTTVANNPDNLFERHSLDNTNTPDARIFTYAGYNYPHDATQQDPIEYTNIYPAGNPKVFSNAVVAAATQQDAADQYDTAYGCYRMPAVGRYVVTYEAQGGSNDDYMVNYQYIPGLSWSAWIGAMKGTSSWEAGANTFATYQEVANFLWRYAQFRQFNIQQPGTFPVVTSESEASSWAQTGAIRWLESHGIFNGYHCMYVDWGRDKNRSDDETTGLYSRITCGGVTPPGIPMSPKDLVDRAEFAYMIRNFCEMYAW